MISNPRCHRRNISKGPPVTNTTSSHLGHTWQCRILEEYWILVPCHGFNEAVFPHRHCLINVLLALINYLVLSRHWYWIKYTLFFSPQLTWTITNHVFVEVSFEDFENLATRPFTCRPNSVDRFIKRSKIINHTTFIHQGQVTLGYFFLFLNFCYNYVPSFYPFDPSIVHTRLGFWKGPYTYARKGNVN